MSVVNSHDVKILLPRDGMNPFWERVLADAADDDLRLRDLAMVALREQCGWPMHVIAAAFDRHKGQVSRLVARTKRELREEYDLNADDPLGAPH